jgi:hypothetical protein
MIVIGADTHKATHTCAAVRAGSASCWLSNNAGT